MNYIRLYPYSAQIAAEKVRATAAEAALSAAIGGKQNANATLSALAALTLAANKIIYLNGSGNLALADLTTFARSILDDGDATTARATLGLTIGSQVQGYDATLAALAALTTAANKLIYATGADSFTTTDLTAFGRSLIGATDATAVRSLIGSVIGTNVQAYDATLAALAAVSTSANKLIYATGADTFATTDITAAARTLLDDADAAAMRATLGLVPGTNVQAYSAQIAAIAALASSDDDVIQRKSGAWVSRTMVQLKADLGLPGDVAQTQGLPGDAPLRFASTLTGEPAAAPAAVGAYIVNEDRRILRVTGVSTTATRERIALEPGKVYRARFAVRRHTDPADPAGDTVRFGVQWLTKNKAALSIREFENKVLTIADGRYVVEATFASVAGPGIDYTAPATARYFVPFVYTFGSDHETDIEVIAWDDVSDTIGLVVDVADAVEATEQAVTQVLAAVEAVPVKSGKAGKIAHIFTDAYGFSASGLNENGAFRGADGVTFGPDATGVTAFRDADGNAVATAPGGGAFGIPGAQAVASPLASIAQAEGDRYGFIASVRRASSSAYEHGDRILRIDRRYRFLSAHGDRYGFMAGVTREDPTETDFGEQRAAIEYRYNILSAERDRYGFLGKVARADGSPPSDWGDQRAVIDRSFQILQANADRYGFMANVLRMDGSLVGYEAASDVSPSTSISDDYSAAMNARALGAAALRRNIDTLEIAQPTADWNVVLTYGQSLASGQECWPALTTSTALTSSLGLYMLGDADRPQSDSNGSWLPIGTAQLNPLKATVWNGTLLDAAAQAALPAGNGSLGENPGIAATITARKMWLAHLGAADDGRKWIHANCAVSGQTIEQLSYGATPHLFGRMIDFATRLKTLADTQGKTLRIIAVNFLQGEYNMTTAYGGAVDRTTNRQKREQMQADIMAYVCSVIGQTDAPAWVEYQSGSVFTVNGNDLGVQMAQFDLIEQHRTASFGSQPSFAVTDKGGHLDPNGSRWLGSMMGRALGHVLTKRKGYWPLTPFNAVWRGRDILVSHLVPQPPLQWLGAWRWTGSAHEQTVYANKGFTLIDASGDVPITSVAIERDAVVRITAARDLVGPVTVRLAGQDSNGNHNLFDSDPTVLPLPYVYSAGSGQYAAANIPALVGKSYPAQSAAYAYNITASAI